LQECASRSVSSTPTFARPARLTAVALADDIELRQEALAPDALLPVLCATS